MHLGSFSNIGSISVCYKIFIRFLKSKQFNKKVIHQLDVRVSIIAGGAEQDDGDEGLTVMFMVESNGTCSTS